MDTTLRRLQLTQLEILHVIDDLCRKEQIAYSLYAGTMLGAVRHGGFIPWDDDLDICMTRREYDRFLETWRKAEIPGYTLQNKDTTPRFTQSFTKIRKDHTTFIQDECERGAYHTGIFVDVFPIDRMPLKAIRRAAFTWNCLNYLLLCREFIPPNGSALEKLVSSTVLACSPKDRRAEKRKSLLQRITGFDKDRSLPMVATEIARTIRQPLPSDLMDEYVMLPFEDSEFPCCAQWDAWLRIKYGDYMSLPPEAERSWKHHPIVLDFEHADEENN